jgi:flagellar motor switch protein FliG
MQIEFEQILHLPPWMLAELLSNTDSQVVLLALAGATPQFMKRFMNMLDRRDARALQNRLQQIGSIRLRDVDDAQRQIVENAARWTQERGPQPISTQRPQRAAA